MAVYTGALTGSLQFSSGSTTYEIKPTSNNIEVIGGLHVSGSSGLLVNGRNIITSIDNLQSGSSPQVGALNLFTKTVFVDPVKSNLGKAYSAVLAIKDEVTV